MNPAPVRQCEEGRKGQASPRPRRGARDLRARGGGDGNRGPGHGRDSLTYVGLRTWALG